MKMYSVPFNCIIEVYCEGSDWDAILKIPKLPKGYKLETINDCSDEGSCRFLINAWMTQRFKAKNAVRFYEKVLDRKLPKWMTLNLNIDISDIGEVDSRGKSWNIPQDSKEFDELDNAWAEIGAPEGKIK